MKIRRQGSKRKKAERREDDIGMVSSSSDGMEVKGVSLGFIDYSFNIPKPHRLTQFLYL